MNQLEVIDFNTLDQVNGGIDRNTYVTGGKAIGTVGGAVAGGAAGGYVSGGNPHITTAGAATGSMAGGWLGKKLGGAVWDAGTALGNAAANWYYGK